MNLAARARILLVEDEAHIAQGLRANLLAEGYEVELAATGPVGLRSALSAAPDLVVLDVMLPEQDGFSVCQQARADGFAAPILFLSAKASAEERMHGLSVGGDDYLGKPFHLGEFLGRVQALLRRARRYEAAAPPAEILVLVPKGVRVNLVTGEVHYAEGRREYLPARELRLIELLWRKRDCVITREELLEHAWGDDVWPSSRVLHACIERWQQRVEPDPSRPRWLQTVPGVGYCFATQVSAPAAQSLVAAAEPASPDALPAAAAPGSERRT